METDYSNIILRFRRIAYVSDGFLHINAKENPVKTKENWYFSLQKSRENGAEITFFVALSRQIARFRQNDRKYKKRRELRRCGIGQSLFSGKKRET
ncbi:MAG: hypothetical protein ACI4I8_07400 [Oscillospiraceae bacterium]